jgi:two-component system chemotaxis response regulator CheB
VGVVLSGNLYDGAAGLWAIKANGGVAVVQHPEDARFPSMPKAALEKVVVDYCIPAAAIGALLTKLARDDALPSQAIAELAMSGIETRMALGEPVDDEGFENLGAPSSYACPECGAALVRIVEGCITRYRCRVGHGFDEGTLAAALDDTAEDALWTAYRVRADVARYARHLADRERAAGPSEHAAELEARASREARRANAIRRTMNVD